MRDCDSTVNYILGTYTPSPTHQGILITRRFITKTTIYRDRRPDINKISDVSISLFRNFSCITLNRLRDPRGIKQSAIQCTNDPLGCSFSRTRRRGTTLFIALNRGNDIHFRTTPLVPQRSLQRLQNDCVRLASHQTCSNAPASSCLRVALASRRSIPSTLTQLQIVCPGLVQLSCSGHHAQTTRAPSTTTQTRDGAPLRRFTTFCRTRGNRPLSSRRTTFYRSLVRSV